MLDLGFRPQLMNILIYYQKRQNIMFLYSMTEEVDILIKSYFKGERFK